MTLNSFQFNTTPGLRFGSGQVKNTCKEMSEKLGERILFITDKVRLPRNFNPATACLFH